MQRFSDQNNAAFSLAALHPNRMKKESLEDTKAKISIASEIYCLYGIEHELELWHHTCKNKTFADLVNAHAETEFYPKTKLAIEILLAMPCTTATVERSFSTLRRVKTWLRTTMIESRLNGKSYLLQDVKFINYL